MRYPRRRICPKPSSARCWTAGCRAGAEAEALRRQIATHGGGFATLVRAPAHVRAAVPVFEPQPEALAALAARMKEQFDPLNILNPGRMYA